MAPTPQTALRELVIRNADGKTITVPLDRDRVSLGRSSVSDICFPDDVGLSRQHLAFVRTKDGWNVEDLGSKNGTLVNGTRINTPTPFRTGDRISAGHLTVEFPETSAPGKTVVFVDADPPATSQTTVVASLDGVLGPQGEDFSKTYVMQGSPQMRALIRAGRELAGHRPLEELFRVIMDLSVEAVCAGRGVLMTLEGDDLVIRAHRGDNFRISSTVRDRVIKEKASLLVRDAQLDQAFKDQMSIVEQRVRSMLAVPLQTNDRVIGLIYLDSPHLIHEFTREDLNLLTVMANVAAIRIEHARLIDIERAEQILAKELEQAAQIQRRLLPITAPQVPGLDLAGHNAPCRTVGGDYYDFITYADGRVMMMVGDVAGKGMPAALLMSSLQARVQVLFEEPEDLGRKITRLNKAICASCPDNRFITFFAGVLDPATGELTCCNAGHNPPLIVRADGGVETLSGGGVILGILPIAQYQQFSARLERGDTLVLFSDGVTEAAASGSEDEFGEDRLGQCVSLARHKSAQEILDSVISSVSTFTAGGAPADDVTVVIARRV